MSLNDAKARLWSELAAGWLETSDRCRAISIGILCTTLFVLVNWRNKPVDNIALALLPVTLFRHGTLDLDVYRAYYEDLSDDENYSFTESKGHLYPMKSYFSALLAAPLFLPPILAGVPDYEYRPDAAPGDHYSVDIWFNWGRLASALLCGLSVSLVYLALRRWGDVTQATWFSLLFGFGTCVWTWIAQSLSHQLGAVVCTAALLLVLQQFPLSPGRAAWAGFLAGATVVMRPPTVVMLFPLGIYLQLPGVMSGWKARLGSCAGVIVMPLINAVANHFMFGHWYTTGYPKEEVTGQWTTPIVEGALGLLISPNSGLLPQSPFTWLAFVGAWAVWRRADIRDVGLLRAYSLCFVPYWLMFACWHDWKGGLTFTTRMLSEGYPLWMPLVVVGWNVVRGVTVARWFTFIAGAYAVFYQLVNVAIFDAVMAPAILMESTFVRASRQYPWSPRDHFLLLYMANFGFSAALQSMASTLLRFFFGLMAVGLATRPLWKRSRG